ncbi:MAG TPA: hypothetical protein VEF04_13180, partial [Blastocatellia bacterium]|nr:hypothetical protein [Blastocatellia bacterium]
MSREVEVSAESNRVIKNVLNPLAVFRAHKTRTLLSGFAAVLTAFLVTLYCSASYESSIAIHLNRARVATINDNAKGSETQISEEEFKKHSEILLSQTVLEAVVKELNLAANTKMAQLEAVAELRQRLKVALSKHQITVSCEDDNADRGAQILKALFEKYEVHYHSLARQAEAAQLLPEKMVALNLTTTELQEKLSQIKVDENADEKTVKRGVLLRQYYQTISQLNATRAELFEVEQRLLELQSFIVKPPTQIESGSYSQPAPIDTHKRSETLPSETEHKQTLTPQNSNQQLIDDLLDAQAKHAA